MNMDQLICNKNSLALWPNERSQVIEPCFQIALAALDVTSFGKECLGG
jgi:hypothetical protein